MNRNLLAQYEEIKKCDDLALTHKIKYFLDYHKDIVLLAYAELIARGIIINGQYVSQQYESMNKSLITFINSKDFSPGPDTLLKELMISLNFDNYQDLSQQTDLTENDASSNKNTISYKNDRKYPALRTISDIYKIFGFVVIMFTVIIAIILVNFSFGFSLIAIVVGALIVISAFAISEAIKVFIDIEENTRLRNKE
jgi:hypothetical protein